MNRTFPAHRTLAVIAGATLAITGPLVGGAEAALPSPAVGAAARASAPAVDALWVAEATSTSVTVAWREPAGATRYRVSYADNADLEGARSALTRGHRFRLTDLEPGSPAWVRVRVVEMSGVRDPGPYSATLQVQTRESGVDPAPEPRPTETLFGANYTSTENVDEGLYGGRAEVARVYFQQLDSAKFSNSTGVREALADGIDTFVVSWKETDPAAIRTFLAGIPDGLTIYASFNHEPENDAGAPGTASYDEWAAEFRRQWTVQAPLMRAEGFIPTTILMAYTLTPRSGRDIADWTPPRGTVDVFAFDAYYGGNTDPSAAVDRMTAAAAAAGTNRTGVAETGAAADDPNRVADTRELRNAMIDAGTFEWGLYWNAVDGDYDGRMDPQTADAWFG